MKLGGASSPVRTPASQAPAAEASTPKLVIKSVNKHEEDSGPSKSSSSSGGSQDDQPGSPEIAKFSALITRPPRSQQKKGESPPVVPILKIKEVQSAASKQKEAKETAPGQPKAKEPKDVPPLKIKAPTPMPAKGPSTPKAAPTPKTPAATPKMPEEKKSPGSKKVREKKEKKEKKAKEPKSAGPAMPSGAGPSSMPASSLDVALNPQVPAVPPPIMSPPIDTPKSSKKQEQSTGLLTETVGPIGHFVDDQGNEVWICPTCGKQDDGSPMIGCDTCNDWYHWVCVGIQVPPNDDVNWYCPRCLSQHKQRGAPPDKKKRGRKKK
ncbi:putative transcription initiation factor TFIID subunit 3 [Penaeus vannamei]|uniref:Putative transcription initiation factor TFIID subunit 3 n=2 Tax=Penaeus vannamei TaxID=6689 RepID=A0A3R7NCB6_PENVA|nr:putative transcription initiation factor TFIID subunit 3 [Penaeus vannamei]